MDDHALHILLVDDDEVDVMNVQRAFARHGAQNSLHLASNGVEALQRLRDGSIPERRLILLDLNMPRMNGIEFLRALRADPALHSSVVVVLTTSNEERDKLEAHALAIAGYLLKPVSYAAFADAMAALEHTPRAQVP